MVIDMVWIVLKTQRIPARVVAEIAEVSRLTGSSLPSTKYILSDAKTESVYLRNRYTPTFTDGEKAFRPPIALLG